jgi:hypothetical protein
MVLEQRKATDEIYVAELIPDGAGEKAGVGVGDTLISTSAGEPVEPQANPELSPASIRVMGSAAGFASAPTRVLK